MICSYMDKQRLLIKSHSAVRLNPKTLHYPSQHLRRQPSYLGKQSSSRLNVSITITLRLHLHGRRNTCRARFLWLYRYHLLVGGCRQRRQMYHCRYQQLHCPRRQDFRSPISLRLHGDHEYVNVVLLNVTAQY